MFLRDYPLAKITSLGVGGPADYFLRPASVREIIQGQRFALEKGCPLTIIGYGTNLLVRDGGIRGVVMQIAEPFARAQVEGTAITAWAGCLFSSLSKLALSSSLGGLEFAVGIPGGLGGAVFMNAGAYDGEIGPLVRGVEFVENGNLRSWEREEFSFSYRSSRFQEENKGAIVTRVVLELKPDHYHFIFKRMQDLQIRRSTRQPLEYPSAGSTFKRPPGYYVGPLIEKAGLKGLRLGGAQVSSKHAGFIIKKGAAQARDFLDLITHIQAVILQEYGVHLEPEIRILGED